MRHAALITAIACVGCVTTVQDVRDAHDAKAAGVVATAVTVAWDARDDLPTLTRRCREQITQAIVVDVGHEELQAACGAYEEYPVNECSRYVQDCSGLGTIWGCGRAGLVVWVSEEYSERRRCHAIIHGLLHAGGACSGEGTDQPHLDARRWVHAYAPESSAPADVVEAAARKSCEVEP